MNNLYVIISIKNKNLFYKFFNINNHFNKKLNKYILKINNENINFFKTFTKYNIEQIKYILLNNW